MLIYNVLKQCVYLFCLQLYFQKRTLILASSIRATGVSIKFPIEYKPETEINWPLIQVTFIILKNNNKNILNNLIKQRPIKFIGIWIFCVHLQSLSQFYPTLFVVKNIMFLKKVNPTNIQSTWNISTYYFLNLYRKGYYIDLKSNNPETCKEPN